MQHWRSVPANTGQQCWEPAAFQGRPEPFSCGYSTRPIPRFQTCPVLSQDMVRLRSSSVLHPCLRQPPSLLSLLKSFYICQNFFETQSCWNASPNSPGQGLLQEISVPTKPERPSSSAWWPTILQFGVLARSHFNFNFMTHLGPSRVTHKLIQITTGCWSVYISDNTITELELGSSDTKYLAQRSRSKVTLCFRSHRSYSQSYWFLPHVA